MPAFLIWDIIDAAWRDLRANKKAVIMAGWPLAVSLFLMLAAEMLVTIPMFKVAFQAAQQGGANPGAINPALFQALTRRLYGLMAILLPVMLCANSLAFGGWARFVAGETIGWGFGGRGFVPVLVIQIKSFILLIAVEMLGIAIFVGVSRVAGGGPVAAILLGILLVVLYFWLAIRLSLTIPYAAICGKSDLRGGAAITRSHEWRILGLIFCTMLVAMAGMIIGYFALTFVGVIFGTIVVLGAMLLAKISWIVAAPMVLLGGAGVVGFVLAEMAIYLGYMMFFMGSLTRAYLALVRPVEPAQVNPWRV